MNPFQIIATLRKFGNFLVGLFPWVGSAAQFCSGILLRLLGLILTIGVINKVAIYLQDRPAVKGIQSVFKRFYWRDYSKDKLSLEDLPADSVAILRPIFLVSAFLCLFMPLLMLPTPAVPIETFSGLKHDVPVWSVLLWFASAVIAWSALLVGTAVSNRPSFLAGGIAYSYLCGSVVACTTKSPTNVFIPLTILFAVFLHEKTCRAAGKLNACFGAVIAVLLGAAAGVYFFAATTIKMPPTVSSLWISVPIGVCLGLFSFALARLPAKENNKLSQIISAELPLASAFRIVALMLGFNLAILCFRAGLSIVAGHLISLTHLTETYAWPVWYLLAVGIIMKLIKNSDVVAKATADIVGLKLLRPVTTIILATALAIVYCESAVSWFTPGSPFFFISDAGIHIYQWSRSWFWKEPIFAFSAPYIGPILIFDLLCIIWLTFKKRFTDGAAGRFLYLTILAWFLISEYSFEVLSLGRSPSHSIVALMLFSVWLLWLMHTIGLALSARSSLLWPSRGRLPIYGSILIFALLEIHSRGAMQDFKVTNELFLIMERGIIDVGLPYFLWVYVTRRFSALPVGVATVFCMFCAGALIALPFNVLDKLSFCNWDWGQFIRLVDALTQKYISTGNMQCDGTVNWGWLLVKNAIFCLVLWAVLFASRLSYRTRPDWKMIVTFVVVIVASGIASFSKGFLDIGLPASIAVASAPMHLDLLLSQRVLVIYLAAWIPALLLGISLGKLGGKDKSDGNGEDENFSAWTLLRHTGVYLLIGFILSAILNVLFFCCEDFLQSAGAVQPMLALYGLIFVILVSRIIDVEAGAGARVNTDALVEPQPDLDLDNGRKDRRDLQTLVLIATAASLIFFAFNVVRAVASVRQVASLQQDLRVPEEFANPTNSDVSENNQSKASVFTNSRSGTDKSYLVIGKVKTNGLAIGPLLAHLMDKAAKSGQFEALQPIEVKSWKDRYPDALACTYAYNIMLKQGAASVAVPMTGVTVLLPTPDPLNVDFVTVYTPPAELDLRRWQAAWLVDQLKALQKSVRQ